MPPLRGGISTSTQSNATAVQKNLKRNGINSTVEKKNNGKWIINYILSFKQLITSNKLALDLKNDKDIDEKDISMDDSFAAKIVDIDLYLASTQAPNVKFSYIDNKITPAQGLDKLNDYKIQDINTMDNYFQMIEQGKLFGNAQNNNSNLSINNDDEVEKWWFSQTETLKSNLELQFTNCAEEFQLISINLLFNSHHATKFLQHSNYQDSTLMFHGCSAGALSGIFQNGFKLGPGSIGKLYGIGHYVTPQVLHAIQYLIKCKDRVKYRNANVNQYTLIAAFVNPGKVKDVNSRSYANKPISNGYDSHYCKVTDGVKGVIGHPISAQSNYTGVKMEEYAIKESSRILPRFYITLKRINRVFVWRDKKISNQFNGNVLKELKQNMSIYGVTTTDTAIKIIKLKMSKNKVYVITNGADDGEGFVKNVRNTLNLQTPILVFCSAVSWHSKWAKKYNKVSAKSGKPNIVSFINDC